MNIQKIPQKRVIELYGLSAIQINDLIKAGTLTPLFFRGVQTKPYFLISQIEAAIRPK